MDDKTEFRHRPKDPLAPRPIYRFSNERERYMEWLSERITYHCSEKGMVETYWTYDDAIEPELIDEALDNFDSMGFDSPRAYLEARIYEDVGDSMEQELIRQLYDDAKSAPDAVSAAWDGTEDRFSDLERAGYHGIDIDIDGLLNRSTFDVNLMFATDAERDLDCSSIVTAFGNDIDPPDPNALDARDLDNALSYLVNQQGHSVRELYQTLAGKPSTSILLDSVASALGENASQAMSNLTALVRLDGNELLALHERLEEPSGALRLAQDTSIDIFNPWGGCGGGLGIDCEKDVVMPLSMVRRVQLERGRDTDSWGNYTVNGVYGLTGTAWDSKAEIIDETPMDVREDYGRALEAVRAEWPEMIAESGTERTELDAIAADISATGLGEVGADAPHMHTDAR